MKPDLLRNKFSSENYQYAIASDMRSFLGMVNKDDSYLERRVDWFHAYEQGRYIPKAKLSVLPAIHKSDFDRVNREINKDKAIVKVAECSKYASHAMSILLSDKNVTDEYNLCIAGIGPDQNHNVVMLIPKSGSVFEKGPYTINDFPKGTLIVDPWAMAMGYSAEASLAVEPENYVYSGLLEKITLSYQSIKDIEVTPNAVNRQSTDDSTIRSRSVSPKTPTISGDWPPAGRTSPIITVRPASAEPTSRNRPVPAAKSTSVAQATTGLDKPAAAIESTADALTQKPQSVGKISSQRMAKIAGSLFGESKPVSATVISDSARLRREIAEMKKSDGLKENLAQDVPTPERATSPKHK